MLLPAGLVCVGFPFYLFTLPGGWAIIDDTRAAFGAGTDAGALQASYVDCTRQRSGSNSSRGTGMTKYDWLIACGGEDKLAPTGSGSKDAARFEMVMGEHIGSVDAALDAFIEQLKARSGNRTILNASWPPTAAASFTLFGSCPARTSRAASAWFWA